MRPASPEKYAGYSVPAEIELLEGLVIDWIYYKQLFGIS
jgi:hypothetical protein